MKSQLREMFKDKWGFWLPVAIAAPFVLLGLPGFVIGHTEWQLMINEWLGVR